MEAAFEARKASARLTAGSDAVRQVACGGTWFAAVVARPGGEAGAGNEMMNELMWKGQEVDGVLLSAWLDPHAQCICRLFPCVQSLGILAMLRDSLPWSCRVWSKATRDATNTGQNA